MYIISPMVRHRSFTGGMAIEGKDTGYPAVNEVDQRIGGYDGMMRLMEEGPG